MNKVKFLLEQIEKASIHLKQENETLRIQVFELQAKLQHASDQERVVELENRVRELEKELADYSVQNSSYETKLTQLNQTLNQNEVNLEPMPTQQDATPEPPIKPEITETSEISEISETSETPLNSPSLQTSQPPPNFHVPQTPQSKPTAVDFSPEPIQEPQPEQLEVPPKVQPEIQPEITPELETPVQSEPIPPEPTTALKTPSPGSPDPAIEQAQLLQSSQRVQTPPVTPKEQAEPLSQSAAKKDPQKPAQSVSNNTPPWENWKEEDNQSMFESEDDPFFLADGTEDDQTFSENIKKF